MDFYIENMLNFMNILSDIEVVVDFIKIFCLSMYTIFVVLKITNFKPNMDKNKIFIYTILLLLTAIITKIAKIYGGLTYAVITLGLLLSAGFCIISKNSIVYSIIVVLISLGLNYIFLLIAISLSFLPSAMLGIKENYIYLCIILIVYTIFIYYFLKTNKFKYGFSFLEVTLKNEYFYMIISNISLMILLLIMLLSSYKDILTNNIYWTIIITSILMFFTIQKSIQLYYKQKMLVQDLEETKQELESKKQEIKQLEKENLNFSKTSHSIAHKQKALEYKLNELILKNEIASEIDIKDRIEKISDDIKNRPISVGLAKTEIPEIDDMLKYMQSECINNKIDFQLQLSGNIYHMINNYIEKENLEILLADMIKNAIIAINYSENINKSILVRLGEIDNIYALYVYDSGIDFKIETFKNMGIKPCTTHADNGGTGMGLMNTFDTLKKYKASIIINEYNEPCKDNFTKVIIIKFDNKEETKICSYRYKEIEKEVKSENLKIEKIQKSIDIN